MPPTPLRRALLAPPLVRVPRKRWPVAHRVLVYCLSLGNEGPGAARVRSLPRPADAPQTPAEEPGSGWGRGSPGLGQPPSSSPAWEPVFGFGTRDIDESVYVQPKGRCLRFRVRERRAGLRAPSRPSARSFSGGASSPRGRPLRPAPSVPPPQAPLDEGHPQLLEGEVGAGWIITPPALRPILVADGAQGQRKPAGEEMAGVRRWLYSLWA